jgi:hypothetical protein
MTNRILGPLCYECSNATSILECAGNSDEIRSCDAEEVCQTTISHLESGERMIDKGCAAASECVVTINDWNACRAGTQDCTLCCKDDYCNFLPIAAVGKVSASSSFFDRPLPTCQDIIPPTFSDCPPNITVSKYLEGFTEPVVVSWPTVEDNFYNLTVWSTLSDLTSEAYVFNEAVQEVNWTVRDEAGLESVCRVPVIYQGADSFI